MDDDNVVKLSVVSDRASDWSVDEALQEAQSLIENGEIEANAALIILVNKNGKGTGYNNVVCNLKNSECMIACEIVKQIYLDVMMGMDDG